jgi:hypothetical protein
MVGYVEGRVVKTWKKKYDTAIRIWGCGGAAAAGNRCLSVVFLGPGQGQAAEVDSWEQELLADKCWRPEGNERRWFVFGGVCGFNKATDWNLGEPWSFRLLLGWNGKKWPGPPNDESFLSRSKARQAGCCRGTIR